MNGDIVSVALVFECTNEIPTVQQSCPSPIMVQKLVSIFLHGEGMRVRGEKAPAERHGTVEEHLEPDLKQGWNIVSVTMGGW